LFGVYGLVFGVIKTATPFLGMAVRKFKNIKLF